VVVRAEEEGRRISWSGLEKRAEMWEAVSERGDRARFLSGRLERGSAEVGMLSGMGSDIEVSCDCMRW
jgi:hypothetical protein